MYGNGHCRSFNGDGRMDIMARDDVTGELLVFPHSGSFRGSETFGEPVLISTDFHPTRNYGLVRPIDVNGNGYADVIGVSMSFMNPTHGIFLYPNKGGLNGLDTLGEPIRISGARDDKKWETLGIADMDLDGCDDMFGREQDAGHVDAFFNQRQVRQNETYDRTAHRMVTVDVEDFPLAMADVTGTGRPDLLVRRANGDLDLYEFAQNTSGEGPWWREEGQWFTLGRGWQEFAHVVVTDIDLDGRPDLLVVRADGTLVVHLHNGKFDPEQPSATFSAPKVLATGWQKYSVVS
ncbi:VCBS repeat-containing protein [Micromonospora sp. C31]|uniref:FG-GAP repeat domain-containing protein n=1 Tax=Micromonospora sp. C31 TaxID=2824876 RepID=UPI0021135568|nr:VCBS repeat-containing protein [Micromonospora sp. C31]